MFVLSVEHDLLVAANSIARRKTCIVISKVNVLMGRTVTNVDRTCGPTHLLVFSGNKICLN